MATWQFDLWMAPRSTHSTFESLKGPPPLDAPVFPADSEATLGAAFDRLLPRSAGWSKTLLAWGSDVGTRIHLARTADGLEVSIRLDARSVDLAFLNRLAVEARLLDCQFFSPETSSVVDASGQALHHALEGSSAGRFVRDPKAFLEAAISDLENADVPKRRRSGELPTWIERVAGWDETLQLAALAGMGLLVLWLIGASCFG